MPDKIGRNDELYIVFDLSILQFSWTFDLTVTIIIYVHYIYAYTREWYMHCLQAATLLIIGFISFASCYSMVEMLVPLRLESI